MRADKQKTARLDRRRFLKGAGFAAGATTAASAMAAKDAVAAGAAAKPQSAGYRETEDIKLYYKSARY